MSSSSPTSLPSGVARLQQAESRMNRRTKSLELERPPPGPAGKQAMANRTVVAVKGISSSAKAEDLCEEKLLSGDIVEQVNVGGVDLVAPFAGGKSGLQRELRRLYNTGDTVVQIKVRRGRRKIATVRASIVLDDSSMLKKQYVLRAPDDPNHVVVFTDSTEEECLALHEMRCARMVSHVANTQLKDLYVSYSWEDRMKQVLPVERSSMVFSMLVVPHAPDRASVPQYNDVEDTVARAMAWLSGAQASGVPINFLNIQTEPLLTKVSGQQASSRTVSAGSRDDLYNIINTGIYGFEDYHGIDIGVVRAVRLWYVPNVAEMAIMLKPEMEDTRLGLGISRTQEGFCYVSSVEDSSVADRSGLKLVLLSARSANKLLVISRVAEEKITPSMVSSSGSIRCFDTISISHKLSIHRQAGRQVRIHLMVWDGAMLARGWGSASARHGEIIEEVEGMRSRDESESESIAQQQQRKSALAAEAYDYNRYGNEMFSSFESERGSSSASRDSSGERASDSRHERDYSAAAAAAAAGEFSFRTGGASEQLPWGALE